MKRICLLALGLSLLCGTARAYTVKQAAACYPDAVRLCGAPRDWRKTTLGQRIEIIGCMIAHQGELSPRCKKAFGK